ncbi:MAG: hypothetical protein H6679_01705 [Epsilonproteobacteria bacterium]|nr:hypothetical protein [Campylobacterota bacterium]
MKTEKKFLLFVLFGALVFAGAYLLFTSKGKKFQKGLLYSFDWSKQINNHHRDKPGHKQVWLNVFVHGSFGSLLGLFSFAKVLQDQISGTTYRKVVKGMRQDEFYFKDQAILQRGLVKVTPTFDLKQNNNRKYGAYPILKAYDEVQHWLTQDSQENIYYTFGWSGLISQNSRRFEAIRLYNALSQELEDYHTRGIYPKIRLLTHSHGGNVCLNLAAIKQALNTHDFQARFSDDEEEHESIKKMFDLLATLPNKEEAAEKADQKIYDYVPTNKSLTIDHLVMFATPIQPETEPLCAHSMFKHLFHLYSQEDYVQTSDWISSKRYYSDRRINAQLIDPKTNKNITQAKMMVEAPTQKTKTNAAEKVTTKLVQADSTQAPALPARSPESLFDNPQALVRKSKDPTHKEFWFISWRIEEGSPITFMTPLPMVILTPLFLHVLEQKQEADVDLNIYLNTGDVTVSLAKHGQTTPLVQAQLPLSLIDSFKEKIKYWKPDDVSEKAEFNAVYRHLR